MTQGPLGSATYGDPAHLHAATAEGSWTGAYDAAGDMTCRAEQSTATCAGGSQTGNQLAYDNLRQLITWQDAPSAPTTTEAFAYDGEGQRVWASSTSGGTTTTTVYVGTAAQYTFSNGSSTGYSNRYLLGGTPIAVRGGNSWHYLLSDHLGTPAVRVSGSGTVESEQLKRPYGRFRYGSSEQYGYGFTGQLLDDAANITYFNARYFDQSIGQFMSPDSVLGADPLGDNYAYVGGMVENATDPSGHHRSECDGGGCGGTDGTIGGGGSGGFNSTERPGGNEGEADEQARLRAQLKALDDFLEQNYEDFQFQGTDNRLGNFADVRLPGEFQESDELPRYYTDQYRNEPNRTGDTTNSAETGTGGAGGAGGEGGTGGTGGGSGSPGNPPPPPPPATPAEEQEGAQQVIDSFENVYANAPVDMSTDTWNWGFKWADLDKMTNPRFGSYTWKYYFHFDDGTGDTVKVSGGFDPYTRVWNQEGWELSHDQPSPFWQDIRDELYQYPRWRNR